MHVLTDIILPNKLLSDRILQYLTWYECLMGSLVSRKWNLCVREFFRRHHQCFIDINLDDQSSVTRIAEVLEKSTSTQPFNGIRFYITSPPCHDLLKRAKVLDSKELQREKWTLYWNLRKIFQRITVKYVLIIQHPMPDITNTSIFYYSLLPVETIEHLEIDGLFMEWSLLLKILKNRKFSSLKTLKVPHYWPTQDQMYAICSRANMDPVSRFEDPKRCEGLQDVLEKCPAMTEWTVPVRFGDVTEFIKARKLILVKNLVILGKPADEDVHHINAMGGLTLKELKAFVDPQKTDIVRQLIIQSINSLESMHLNLDLFKGLITHHQPVYKNLTNLIISYAGTQDQCDLERILKTEVIKVLFPKATIVPKQAYAQRPFTCRKFFGR